MTQSVQVEPVVDDLLHTQGPVLRPPDPRVDAELAGQNLAVEHAPALVVGAARVSDVQGAVSYAAAHALPVGILSTGHQGTSHRDALVVSTRRMDHVEVDPEERIAKVQAGARWAQVIEASTPHGLAPLNGSSPTVGVVGYTLGGGIGPLARQYGYAADHVRSIDVVTAEGRCRTVDATHDPDLFWALRGGKGSFGVVTSIEFQLFPVARLFGGSIVFAGSDADAVLRAYTGWVPTLSDSTTTSIALLKLPDAPHIPAPLRGRMTVHLRVAHIGAAQEGAALVAPMRAVARPLADTLADMPYSAVASIHNDPIEPMPTWHQGCLLREVDELALDTLIHATEALFRLPFGMIDLRHLGGALGRQPAQPNAVCGREAGFLLGIIGLQAPGSDQSVQAAGGAIVDAMDPWRIPVLPLNYLSEVSSPEQAGAAWSAPVYRRLLQVKAMYDPRNLFRTGCAVLPQNDCSTTNLTPINPEGR